MPSPSRRMMFLASAALWSPVSPITWTVEATDTDPVASAKVAVSWCRPGFLKAWARTLNPPHCAPEASAGLIPSVVLVFWTPEVKATGTPSTDRVAVKGPAPSPSTRMSKRCPSRKRAPLGGTSVTLVGAASAGSESSATSRPRTAREFREFQLMGPFLLPTSLWVNRGRCGCGRASRRPGWRGPGAARPPPRADRAGRGFSAPEAQGTSTRTASGGRSPVPAPPSSQSTGREAR